MGRRKIEIKKIEDAQKRNVAFSKRRKGLASKFTTLCEKSDAEDAALIFFSPTGKVFSYSHGSSSSSSSVDDTLERFQKKKRFVDTEEELDTVEKLMAEKKYLVNLKQRLLERMEELKISSSSSCSSSYLQKNEEQDMLVESLTEDERIVAETLSIMSSKTGTDLNIISQRSDMEGK